MDTIETDKPSLLQRFILWRETHVKERHFVLFLSLVVGVLTALAGTLLKRLIEFIKTLLTENFEVTSGNWQYLVYPVIGIFLTGLFIRHVVKDDIGHGVTKILYAISRRQSRIKRHNTWSSVIASAITIGFGGSVGAEAPIVLTGSAIGSNLGSLFKMDHKTLMLLVGCGAAGAVAGIFKAPIAGLVFTLEVLMIDLTMGSLLPLLVSSVTAATVSYILNGFTAMFRFHMDNPFIMGRIPAVILLGIVCGLVSLYFTRMTNGIENIFRRYTNPYVKLAMGGVMLSILIFLFPSLYGEGYDTIELLLNGTSDAEWNTVMNGSLFYGYAGMLLVYLCCVILFKVFATCATNGGGGCGGIFAPSLFLGCITGFVMARFCNSFPVLPFIPDLPEKNFALLGMAGLMSGVMHAPLTGIFLIAELTGGYDLFLPLMIVSVSAYLTIMVFEPHSIYSMRLAKKGELITHHKDRAVLTLMSIESVVETNFEVVYPDMDLAQMVSVIAKARRNIFPVVEKTGELIGIVALDDIRNIMFRQELYHRFKVEKFMTSPPARIYVTDSMEVVMRKFDESKAWNLPVIDEEGKYKGFVSKSKIFNTYRQVLVDLSAE
jgi:CIC family chloride channel protein